jgi:ricin-type beta-trefoil lectin protein
MRWTKLVAILAALFSIALLHSGPAGADTSTDASVLAGQEIHSVLDGRCLDVYDGGRGPWVQVWPCNGWANQWFQLGYYGGDIYQIRTGDGWCVDGRWGKGASLERAWCDGSAGQKWRVVPHGVYPGWAIYSVQYPHLVWDISGFGASSKVQLWEGNGGAHQAWVLPF